MIFCAWRALRREPATALAVLVLPSPQPGSLEGADRSHDRLHGFLYGGLAWFPQRLFPLEPARLEGLRCSERKSVFSSRGKDRRLDEVPEVIDLPGEILLVGCGYVGTPLAAILRDRGRGFLAWVRTEESRARLRDSGIPAIAGDIGSEEAWRGLAKPPDFLIFGPSSSRGGPKEYRNVFVTALGHAFRRFPGARLLFLSSTSVYGQSEGELVDEASSADPESETGRILRDAERIALDAGGVVLRIAGIYGPGRTHLLDRYRRGEATISPLDRWINQVHRDDVVSAILHFLALRLRGTIVNVVDDEPVRESGFFSWLAEILEMPLPPSGSGSVRSTKRKRTHKRVSNARARALGWNPRYRSFREGLLPLLKNRTRAAS